MKEKWTITIDCTPIAGGTIESWVNRCWACAKAWVNKNGGCAQLIKNNSMVVDFYRKEVRHGSN